ncbi:MAG: Rab family GTPase [Woeseiaceae bacterium]
MTPVTSKVCVVGDFAVGKTSVVERFVTNHFSDKYLSTVGVKIDTKEIEFAERGIAHKLVIWDVAGADRFGDVEFSYLRGASGFIYVADGTRSLTLKSVEQLHTQITEKYGPAPSVLLVNKSDLVADWSISDTRFDELADNFARAYRSSAKTGDEVDQAFKRLAALIIDNDLQRA